MITQPICIYNNWSTYDELSDNVELTEELAMRQLDEMLRLREHGVRFDYYLMDAFWFAPDGGYRTWRTPHWPNGPDRWLARCLENGIKPGLWVSSNTLCHIDPVPQWEDSLNTERWGMCMFTGGFLRHFIETLQHWYDRGVRAYKFDFVRFDAATPEVVRTHLPADIQRMNEDAYYSALRVFRECNPDVVLLGYNGLGGDQGNTSTPVRKNVDSRWLEVFDSIYCGDPRPADVACMDFWRSMEIYSDHMVRFYQANDIPLERIDNTAFMIGTTGTCCKRGKAAWKAMLLGSLARGGWVNIYYGNLGLLSDDDAAWFGKTQSMFLDMQARGRFYTFGGLPGEGVPYGFAAVGQRGSLYTVVNPSQAVVPVVIPRVSDWQIDTIGGRVLFRDAGFAPQLSDAQLTLGPEQVALIGFGDYASQEFDLGVQEDVVVPSEINRLPAEFAPGEVNSLSTTVEPPDGADLRIVLKQFDPRGKALRVSGGAPPSGTPLDRMLTITVSQSGRELPVSLNYGKAIWSGLSWAVVEVRQDDMDLSVPIEITCRSAHSGDLRLAGEVYTVKYE